MTQLNIKSILDIIPDSAFFVDKFGKLIYVNDPFLKLFNLDINDIKGKFVDESFKDELHRKPFLWYVLNDSVNELYNIDHYDNIVVNETNDVFEAESYIIVDNNTLHLWIKVILVKDDNGDILGAIEFIRDITNFNNMCNRLKSYEYQLDSIIYSVPDLFFKVNQKNQYVECYGNPDLLIDDLKNIIGKTPIEIFPHPIGQQTEGIIYSVRNTLKTQRDIQQITTRYDEKVWIARTFIPIEDGYVLSLIQNIDNYKRIEKDLEDSKLKLLEMNKTMSLYVGQVNDILNESVNSLANTVQYSDAYTYKHQMCVEKMSNLLYNKLNNNTTSRYILSIASRIHDIGKLAIPREILIKPTKLSKIEFELIKEHSERGYDIIKNIPFEGPIAEIIYQHHEREDGSGYPRGLTSDQILYESKILAVCDTIEAMATHRPYRPALSKETVINEFCNQLENGKYDKTIGSTALDMFEDDEFDLDK